MKRIPNAREVDKALKGTITATKSVLKGLNALAGQVMAKGNYVEAEGLVEKGKEIQAFQTELAASIKRWREIRSNRAQRESKNKSTPLWGYYQPILKALLELDGQATREQLEPVVEGLMTSAFEPGDRDVMARGRERWKVMLQRARKHLVTEGWIEDDRSKAWKITPAGRKAAVGGRASKG